MSSTTISTLMVVIERTSTFSYLRDRIWTTRQAAQHISFVWDRVGVKYWILAIPRRFLFEKRRVSRPSCTNVGICFRSLGVRQLHLLYFDIWFAICDYKFVVIIFETLGTSSRNPTIGLFFKIKKKASDQVTRLFAITVDLGEFNLTVHYLSFQSKHQEKFWLQTFTLNV